MSTMPEKPLDPPPKKSNATAIVIVLAAAGVLGVMCLCCAPALLLPAIQAAREAARRVQCSNHLQQIGLAMHNYHAAHRSFPPAYVADAAGQPLYSWRVLLLPYLEQQVLFDQFDKEKAWDSPENLAVSETNIPTYRCPSSPESPQEALTNYVLVTGPGALFNGAHSPSIAEVPDGTVKTIMLVEVRDLDIHWAEPRDLAFDEIVAAGINGGDHQGCASYHHGGINVAFFDGSAHFLAETLDPEVFRAMLTSDGREEVELPPE